MCLVETWHDSDSVCIHRLRSDGFQVVVRAISQPLEESEYSLSYSSHARVGEVAIPGVHVSLLIIGGDSSSFESLCTRITSGTFTCFTLVLYRTGSVSLAFFDEFSSLLERIVGYNDAIFIVGDLNIHLNVEDDLNSRRLTDLLDAFGFVVHNTGPTQN